MIYFISQGGRFVKVGYCKNHPRHRLNSIQSHNPYLLELEMVLEGDEKDEKKVQKMFRPFHLRGEWFFFTGEIERQLEAWRGYCIMHDYDSKVPGRKLRTRLRKGMKGRIPWD